MDRRQFIKSGSTAAVAYALAPSMLRAQTPTIAANSADAQLNALLDRIFADFMERSPEFASSLGFDKGPHADLKRKLSDRSFAGAQRDFAALQRWRTELAALDNAALSPTGRTNLQVVEYLLAQQAVGGEKFDFVSPGSPYAVSQLTGAYQDVPDFLDSRHSIASAEDAEAYLARLDAFGTALDQDSAEVRREAGMGVIAPDFIYGLTLDQMNALRNQPAGQTVLVKSLVRRTGEKKIAGDWGPRAEKIVADSVFPALDRQIALVKELQAKAPHDAGIWRLPHGDAMYAAALANATTTTMSPDEVHRLGLEQVASITSDLDKILRAQGMTGGTVAERLTALNKDPKQLYPNTDAGRADLLAYLNTLVRDMYARLPQAFATLPKAQLQIVRVPVFIQDGAPNGYYNGAPLDGSRPATYYINLKDTGDWPKYGLPTLTYHEGVPGHHLQISLAQEVPNVPMLRRLSPFSAYSEGWALYAEQLADEMGVYKDDPLGRAGFLQSFLFRAARLVVDTGIHYKHWGRDQATDYMVQATGFARPRTQREIDRYCVWPGQACSYKIGHTAWIRARDNAKAKLGARFDIRQFHQVLLDGAVPLTMLDQLVERRLGTA